MGNGASSDAGGSPRNSCTAAQRGPRSSKKTLGNTLGQEHRILYDLPRATFPADPQPERLDIWAQGRA